MIAATAQPCKCQFSRIRERECIPNDYYSWRERNISGKRNFLQVLVVYQYKSRPHSW